MVTNWEKVDSDNFYLSDEWSDRTGEHDAIQTARELMNEGKLFTGYYVRACDYAIYYQMDADEIFINEDGDEIARCESAVIGNEHEHRQHVEEF